MKNINYSNLVQNIIRCMFAYPFFLVLFVLTIPLNAVIWLIMMLELFGHATSFVIHGKFDFQDSMAHDIFDSRLKWFEIAGGLFILSWLVFEKFLDFNSTLRPIR